MENKELNNGKFKVAIIEDNVFYKKLLQKQIEEHFREYCKFRDCDFIVNSYTNGFDFFKNRTDDVDAVLLDFYLPDGENAVDIIERLKIRKDNKSQVIIMSSADNLNADQQIIELGAIDFIHKDPYAAFKSCDVLQQLYLKKFGMAS